MSGSLKVFLRPARRPSFRIQCHPQSYTVTRRKHQESTTGQAAGKEQHAPAHPNTAGPTIRKVPVGNEAPAHQPNEQQPIFKRIPINKRPIPQLEGDIPKGIKVGPTSLQIELKGKEDKPFEQAADYATLRDACQCDNCVDQHSKQRSFRTSDVPSTITPRSVKWDGENLEIKWKNDVPGYDESHTSTYSASFLKSPASYSVGDATPSRYRILWDSKRMQRDQHWISYEDYINDDAKFTIAMRKLAQFGLLFVKDIPDSREMVERIATRMGPLRNSFYGSTWDVRTVPQAKNVAYTNVFLGFHMDLMYMNDPPAYQLLHCLKNSCDGGESLFSDSFAAARRVFQKDKSVVRLLQEFPLNYEYVHEDQIYHHSWPLIETTKPGSSNSMHFRHINYSPPFQGALRPRGNVDKWSNTFERFREALAAFAKELEDEQSIFELKLNPGECVIFENRRVVHARRGFNTSTGERWLAGAYVDEDALLSQFRVCKTKQLDAWKAGVSKLEAE